MKTKKPIDPQKLADFFSETEKKPEASPESPKEEPPIPSLAPAYFCPRCHQPLSNRKDPCPHCGYRGYIPMSESETNRIRLILFVILLAVAIVVYIVTRSA